jgi:GNAT superfamily N-acetyltransferase
VQNILYQPMEHKNIDQAVALVFASYDEERQFLPFLPAAEDFAAEIHSKLNKLLNNGISLVALRGEEMIGFMAGIEIPKIWGSHKGFYCPLYAHGTNKENRTRIYEGLYTKMAATLVNQQMFSHTFTFFAHTREVIDTWFWLGFGARCVDLIRQATPIYYSNPEIQIRKLGPEDIPSLAENQWLFTQYLRQSPLFMLVPDEDPVQALTDWLATPNHHLWGAYRDGKPLGHLRIQPDGESFISTHPQVMNITGAYIRDDARHTGVGTILLGAVNKWLMDKGYPLCGVDCESFNVAGARFWKKHFTPYTLTLTRRIEEGNG